MPKIRGREAGWNRFVVNDPDAGWRTAKSLARLCGTDLRNCQRWIAAWLNEGKIEVRSGVAWGRQFRRVIAGRKSDNVPGADPQDDTLPTVSSADEFRSVAAEAIPDLITHRLREIAEQDIDPRAAMAATKLRVELGVGQIPSEEEIEEPDQEEIHRAIAALPPNPNDDAGNPWSMSIEELDAIIAKCDEEIARRAQ
jgi:hypothetical protein